MGSGGLVKITIFSFILFFAGMFFTSCSESEPEITDSVGYVVLDYFSESGTPSARISVFAEISSLILSLYDISICKKSQATKINFSLSPEMIPVQSA